jgi:hypothetical protein
VYSAEIPAFDGINYFYIGNDLSGLNNFSGVIKNFSVGELVPFEDVEFEDINFFTLKLLEGFNVSSFGYWNIVHNVIDPSLNSLISFNYANKNAKVFVDEVQIDQPRILPNFNYESPDPIAIDVEIFSNNSNKEFVIFNDFFVSNFGSFQLPSTRGNFYIDSLIPGEEDTYVQINPALIKFEEKSPLSNNLNLGLRFSEETTGVRIFTGEEGVEFYGIEFLFQVNQDNENSKHPLISSEDFSVLIEDMDIESDACRLFINGVEVTTSLTLEYDYVYHALVVFSDNYEDDVLLGISYDKLQSSNITVGEVFCYSQEIEDPVLLAEERYFIAFNKNTSSIQGGQFSISSDSLDKNASFNQSRNFYQMENMPKVKIIENAWEAIFVNE